MRKELQAKTEHITCDVCSRTMLKGERAEPYLTPSRERKLVCALCAPRAQREGWIRESVAPETPTRPARQFERGSLLRRLRRGRDRVEPSAPVEKAETSAPVEFEPPAQPVEATPDTEVVAPREPRRPSAVPTNAELKLDRALQVFNETEHPRTVSGIARTLGPPYVSVIGSDSSAAEVLVTIAWELAWYQYTVDLSDRSEPVQLLGKGEELEELPEGVRNWNAQSHQDGTLAIGIVEDEGRSSRPDPTPRL